MTAIKDKEKTKVDKIIVFLGKFTKSGNDEHAMTKTKKRKDFLWLLLWGMIIGGVVGLTCAQRVVSCGWMCVTHQAHIQASLARVGIGIGALLTLLAEAMRGIYARDADEKSRCHLLRMSVYMLSLVAAITSATFIPMVASTCLPALHHHVGFLWGWDGYSILTVLLRICLTLGFVSLVDWISEMNLRKLKFLSAVPAIGIVMVLSFVFGKMTYRIFARNRDVESREAVPDEKEKTHDYRLTEDEPGEVMG